MRNFTFRLRRLSHSFWLLLGLLLFSSSNPVLATSLPPNFSESLVAGGLISPTAMAFAPDGRIFVTQQNGSVYIIENGVRLTTPFLSLPVDSRLERGLLGIAFDPNFASNHYLYLYYTTASNPHNRVSRFTANGNVAVPASEFILMELDNLGTAENHNGGALHFGPDGKLYIAVGDNNHGPNSQVLTNRFGKILRINADGSIPTNNPFYNTAPAPGANRSIWALGLRNPFTFDFQPGTGRMFINDVGQSDWEEINDGLAGANYGWPTTEGVTTNPDFESPLYVYENFQSHVTCAITGGAFYNPETEMFPASYVGSYFFADYCGNFIRRYNPVTDTAHDFASNTASAPVDIKVASDGSLYYLAGANTNSGAVYRIINTLAGDPPVISQHPNDQIVAVDDPATFTCRADGSPTPTYQWQRNTVDIPTATSATYTLQEATLANDGDLFRCVASNSQGNATSNSAELTVIDGERPTAAITITLPNGRTLFHAGDTLNYSGTATDAEDGALPASAYTWEIQQHHDVHTHPFVPATSGVTSGSKVINTTSHGTISFWYRVYLTVVDATGLTRTVYEDVFPESITARLVSQPAGLQIKIDGIPYTTPRNIPEVIGMHWQLEAPAPQIVNGISWQFKEWSDGGAATHTVTIPVEDITYTAVFFGCPVMADPSPNNAAPTRNYLTDATPTLTWGRVSWATGYEVQVDNQADFSDPEFQTNTLTAAQLEVTTSTLRDCTYYWRVRAKNANGGWGSWLTAEKFVLNAVP